MKRSALEIIEQAYNMLGYDNTDELNKSVLTAVNTIAMDIFYINNSEGFTPIKTVNDVLDFPEEVINDTIPHGVASLLAEIMDDGEKQQIYAAYYNRKRMKLTVMSSVEDKLPRGEW